MKILIDHADIEQIKQMYNRFPCDGVTTNPSILKAAGRNPMSLLKEIKLIIGGSGQLHVQAVSTKAEEMVKEAQFILRELGQNTFIKIPVTQEGIKAIGLLSRQGINVTATAVYSPMQAFVAAKAGAKYTAPYVNRLDNMGSDGVQIAKDIHDMFKMHDMKTEVLAASFKNSKQILSLCKHGIGSVTAPPEVLDALIKNDATAVAVEVFTKDFYSLVGEGKTMMNCSNF